MMEYDGFSSHGADYQRVNQPEAMVYQSRNIFQRD